MDRYAMDTAAEQRSGTFDLIERRMDSLRSDIRNLTDRARAIADRIFGAEPTPVSPGGQGTTGLAAVRPMALTIESGQEHASGELNDLLHQIARLEAL